MNWGVCAWCVSVCLYQHWVLGVYHCIFELIVDNVECSQVCLHIWV